MICANNKNYPMIKIFQKDVPNNKNDWQNKLIKSIKKNMKMLRIYLLRILTMRKKNLTYYEKFIGNINKEDNIIFVKSIRN